MSLFRGLDLRIKNAFEIRYQRLLKAEIACWVAKGTSTGGR